LYTDLMTCFRSLKALSRKEAARHGLSMNAFIAIRIIGHWGGVTMRELAEHLDVTPGACTQLVDRLAESGLVARKAGADRRAVHVELTPDGQALHAQLLQDLHERFETVLAHFPPDQRGELARSLSALANAFATTQPPTDGESHACNSPNPVAP
jgi:DNA-binding MarR family transcriptional regulator